MSRAIPRKTVQQWQNDFAAAHAVNDGLSRDNANLGKRVREAESALLAALADRDDWKSAFKLIMRLVK